MSSSKQITPISTQLIFGTKIHSKNLTYNDLINYISLRKQFSRLIPQYLNYQNKKYIKNRNFTSNIEVFRKLKQEIISMEESISSLKEKKQKKLEEIEQLRCLMRKIGNKQNNNYNKGTNNYTMRCAQKRETNNNKNNNQDFRGNNNIDKKQCIDNIKGSCDEVEGGISGIHSTSDMSSGKDDEQAPEGGDYQGDEQGDLNLIICDGNSSCCNKDEWHYGFKGEKGFSDSIKSLQEKDCLLHGKDN